MNQDDHTYQLAAQHDQQVAQFTRWMLIGVFSLIVLLSTLIWFADHILQKLPFSVEKNFVAPYVEFYQQQRTLSNENKEAEDYLQRLAEQLAHRMDMPEDITVDIHLLDSSQANAFATLGGNIFVLRGLLDSLPDENSLSMVLAHELAHIKHRDPIVSISRGLAFQLVYSFATGDTGSIYATGTELGMLFFSRELERAADQVALTTLQKYYGHVAGATTFFEQALSHDETDETPEWFHSHPTLQSRIEQLNNDIKSNFLSKGPVKSLELGQGN